MASNYCKYLNNELPSELGLPSILTNKRATVPFVALQSFHRNHPVLGTGHGFFPITSPPSAVHVPQLKPRQLKVAGLTQMLAGAGEMQAVLLPVATDSFPRCSGKTWDCAAAMVVVDKTPGIAWKNKATTLTMISFMRIKQSKFYASCCNIWMAMNT